MKLREIQEVVAGLTEGQQRQLAAYLTQLRLQRHPETREEWSRRLDDEDKTQWVGLAAAKRLLGD